jgi:hypothetical protein
MFEIPVVLFLYVSWFIHVCPMIGASFSTEVGTDPSGYLTGPGSTTALLLSFTQMQH